MAALKDTVTEEQPAETQQRNVLCCCVCLLRLIKLFVCWSFVVHVLPVSSWRARYQLTRPCSQVKEKICDVALKPTWSGSGSDWWHKNLLSPGWKSCVRASTPPSGLRPSWHLRVLESLASSPVGDGFSSGAFNPWCQRVPCVSVSDERGMRTGHPLCDSAERWQQLNQVFACFWQPLICRVGRVLQGVPKGAIQNVNPEFTSDACQNINCDASLNTRGGLSGG